MHGAREPEKPHTNAQVTFIHRTYISGGIRFQVLNILVQNLPKDKTRLNGYYLTRNAFTAGGTDKKMHVNGQRILLSVTPLLALSGKV